MVGAGKEQEDRTKEGGEDGASRGLEPWLEQGNLWERKESSL